MPGGRVVLTARDHRRGLPGTFRVVECPSCRLCRTDPWPDDPAAWYPDHYPQHGGAGSRRHDPQREQRPDHYPQHGGTGSLTTRVSLAALARAGRSGGAVARALGAAIPEANTGGALRPGSRVLDVGAGTGGAVMALRQAGHDAWGVEPSGRAVQAAQAHGNPWLVRGALEEAVAGGGLPAGPWDLVRMSQVLEHVPDPVGTLALVRGLMARGGRLVVGVPNIRSLAGRMTNGSWDGLEVPRHLVHYDRDSLRWVLGLAGFRVASLRTTPLLGVLPGSLDARTAGGTRQRGWGDTLPVRLAMYPLEWALGAIGQGDGLLAVAHPA